MRFFTDADIGAALPWPALIESIEQIMIEPDATAPARTLHTVPDGNGNDASFLLKPGWVAGELIGVKAVTVFPDNGAQELPICLLYTSPSPRDLSTSRMPSSA